MVLDVIPHPYNFPLTSLLLRPPSLTTSSRQSLSLARTVAIWSQTVEKGFTPAPVFSSPRGPLDLQTCVIRSWMSVHPTTVPVSKRGLRRVRHSKKPNDTAPQAATTEIYSDIM